MKKISIIILLSLFLNVIPISVFAKNNEENSDVNLTKHATSSILVEATTGEIIYKQNPNKISSVASLTKMMGLIIIFDFINKGGTTYDEIITVSSYAKSMGGTQLYLETGEKISVNELIKGIVMASANDAMVAMAERVSGTEEAFVKKMNLKAKELGLKNTHFVNCTGFDEENHYSTASDMAKIAMELVNNYPEIYKFSSVYESYVRENTSNKTWIANTNKLVRFYEGADGLKTGSTTDAGKCIAATAKRNGLRLIAISLGYKDVTTRNKETMDLLDYGFNQYEINMLYEKDKKVGAVSDENGTSFQYEKRRQKGAVYNVYVAEDIVTEGGKTVYKKGAEVAKNLITGEDGSVTVKDLPLGSYYVKELKAPDGFVSSDEVLRFDASYQGQDVQTVTLKSVKKNQPTTVEITKSDATTGVELDGAYLKVTDKDGNVVDSWTSSKDAPHVIKYLKVGETYTLHEEFAPHGYLVANDVTFTVKDTGEVQKVEMKDEVPVGELIINKKGEFLDSVTLADKVKASRNIIIAGIFRISHKIIGAVGNA